MRRTIHRRIGLALMVGLALGAAINEVTFALLREESRPAQEIILLIPEGTAELVAAGEQPPAIPSAMSFVAGDRLLVVNEDLVDHQLGSLWIPSGTSASLSLEIGMSQAYECSFQPGRYQNLDVHEALTPWTRLRGILMSGLPLGILLALYGVVAWPLKPSIESRD